METLKYPLTEVATTPTPRLRISNLQLLHFQFEKAQILPGGSLKVMAERVPPHIPSVRETVSYVGHCLNADAASWKIVPQSCDVFSPASTLVELLIDCFIRPGFIITRPLS